MNDCLCQSRACFQYWKHRYPLIGPVQIYSLGIFSYDQKFSCSRPADSGVSVLLIWGLIWFFDCGQYKAIIIQWACNRSWESSCGLLFCKRRMFLYRWKSGALVVDDEVLLGKLVAWEGLLSKEVPKRLPCCDMRSEQNKCFLWCRVHR